ncbi:MAG TPA: replication-relaxation family protein [Paenibacillus sp.]|nr:replication-relaxation family protein [Paenibacillus sp.]
MSERESNILVALTRLRFMTTRQIHRLYGYTGNHGLSVTRRRLREMELTGWIKSWQPSKYDQKIFYLSKQGALELTYRCGVEDAKTYRKSEKAIHYSLIAEVIVQLHAAIPGFLRSFEVEPRFGNLIPDACLEVESDARSARMFLELDRNTESAGYLRDIKMEKYRSFYLTSGASESRPALLIVTSTEYRKSLFDSIAKQFRLPAVCATIDEVTASPLDFAMSIVRQPPL